ncbi:MFS transporter [Halorubrum sp. FL23]|uniref:MFS transporter n=1 Tax=Halorubrum sp. FL23 TaxID=3458704 RepID=UPI004034F09C
MAEPDHKPPDQKGIIKTIRQQISHSVGKIGDATAGIIPAPIRKIAPTAVGALITFGTLLIFRINAYPFIFRDGNVVSPLNDPYYFRYWMEQLLAEASGPTDLSVIAESNGVAFDGVRPATHAVNWWLAELIGPNAVTAWLPVVSSLVVGVALCGIAYSLTRDLRVGFATVGMLAFVPLHAVYSGIGFLEHNAHQYFWLAGVLAGFVWLARRSQYNTSKQRATAVGIFATPRTWGIAAGTAVAIGLYTHTAGSTPLFIVPLFVYAVFRVPMVLRAGHLPTRTLRPLCGATIGGALLAAGLHVFLGWGELFVVLAPICLAVGTTVLVGVGDGWYRADLPVAGLIPVEFIASGAGIWSIQYLFTDAIARYRGRSDDLFGRAGIAETVSLFDPGILSGPVLRLGVGFVFAIPVLVWLTAVVARRNEPGWLLLVVYGWGTLMLAFIQNRFAGHLSLTITVFAGVGFVATLNQLGVARPLTGVPGPRTLVAEITTSESAVTGEQQSVSATPDPEPTRLAAPTTRRAYLGLGGAIGVTGLASAVLVDEQTTQTSYSDAEYRAMRAISAHNEAVSRAYPANFVLSRWGTNRMYNYFTSGESESYGFARNTYPEFVAEQNPDEWAQDQLGRVGYVVIDSDDVDLPAGTAYHMLQQRLGVAMEYRDPLAHYRLVYLAGESGDPETWDLSAYAVVAGATIQGTGTPGETVVAGTEVTVSGVSFPYQRATTVTDEGEYALTVAYPGTYTIGATEVSVTETAVVAGESISVTD